MKKTKIIVPAMGLLLLGTAASVTGTVAWFSVNTSVAVTGMNVRTSVGSNLLIATTNTEASYRTGLNQAVNGILEPVSSINGVNFFYHSTSEHVLGDGSVDNLVFVAYAEGDTFDANYGFPSGNSQADCYGYKDYSFYIKVTNGDNAARNLIMSKCNLTYRGGAITDKAWRVAMFAKSTSANTTVDDATAVDVENLKTILRPNTAAYFTPTKAVSATDARADVNAAIDDAANVASLDAAATGYYKIVVRLWLEGEDTTCNNETYASLTGDYSLDLKFELSSSDGVALLGSEGNAVISKSTTTATLTLNAQTNAIGNGEIAVGYQWYNEASGIINDATGTSYTNTANAQASVYCMVTTSRGNVYRSNTVVLDAAS